MARVFGDTVAELEAQALEVARTVFGDAARLEIEPDYDMVPVFGILVPKAGGKRYVAAIRVHGFYDEPGLLASERE